SVCASPPAAPSGLGATAVSSSQINLSWVDNASNETSFKIERATASAGPWTQIATTLANVTSYSNTGLSASTAYYYRVRASNATGDSAYSNTATATTLGAANQPPIANAGADQSTTVGVAVTLSGSGSYDPDGTIASYGWDFGDGTTGSSLSVTHTYSSVGTYYVTLTVTDNAGARGTDQAYVDVVPAIGGQFDWAKRFGGAPADIAHAVATDANGNVAATGQFTGTVDFGRGAMTSAGGYDVFLAKYSPTGTAIWTKRFGGAGSDIGYKVAFDPNGDILLT